MIPVNFNLSQCNGDSISDIEFSESPKRKEKRNHDKNPPKRKCSNKNFDISILPKSKVEKIT